MVRKTGAPENDLSITELIHNLVQSKYEQRMQAKLNQENIMDAAEKRDYGRYVNKASEIVSQSH